MSDTKTKTRNLNPPYSLVLFPGTLREMLQIMRKTGGNNDVLLTKHRAMRRTSDHQNGIHFSWSENPLPASGDEAEHGLWIPFKDLVTIVEHANSPEYRGRATEFYLNEFAMTVSNAEIQTRDEEMNLGDPNDKQWWHRANLCKSWAHAPTKKTTTPARLCVSGHRLNILIAMGQLYRWGDQTRSYSGSVNIRRSSNEVLAQVYNAHVLHKATWKDYELLDFRNFPVRARSLKLARAVLNHVKHCMRVTGGFNKSVIDDVEQYGVIINRTLEHRAEIYPKSPPDSKTREVFSAIKDEYSFPKLDKVNFVPADYVYLDFTPRDIKLLADALKGFILERKELVKKVKKLVRNNPTNTEYPLWQYNKPIAYHVKFDVGDDLNGSKILTVKPRDGEQVRLFTKDLKNYRSGYVPPDCEVCLNAEYLLHLCQVLLAGGAEGHDSIKVGYKPCTEPNTNKPLVVHARLLDDVEYDCMVMNIVFGF